jgi:hypothetical protein
MPPKTVYIIRHCDKPDANVDGCNDIGYQRALLLAGWNGSCEHNLNTCNNKCTGSPNGNGYWDKELKGQKPTKLLAPLSKNDKPNSQNTYNNQKCTSANRCCLILNPTAARYNLTINEDGKYFCDNQGADIGKYILSEANFNNGIIIIAWEHKDIHNLINALGVDPQLSKWPKDSSDRFDLVFKVDFINNKPILTISTQNLGLPGDATTTPFNYKSSLQNVRQNDNKNKNKNNTILIAGIVISIILFIIIILFLLYMLKK